MYILLKHAFTAPETKMNLVEARSKLQSKPPKLSFRWMAVEATIVVAIAALMVQMA